MAQRLVPNLQLNNNQLQRCTAQLAVLGPHPNDLAACMAGSRWMEQNVPELPENFNQMNNLLDSVWAMP